MRCACSEPQILLLTTVILSRYVTEKVKQASMRIMEYGQQYQSVMTGALSSHREGGHCEMGLGNACSVPHPAPARAGKTLTKAHSSLQSEHATLQGRTSHLHGLHRTSHAVLWQSHLLHRCIKLPLLQPPTSSHLLITMVNVAQSDSCECHRGAGAGSCSRAGRHAPGSLLSAAVHLLRAQRAPD